MEESATRQYLTFVLGGERFALESLLVSEVLDLPVTTRVPLGPPCLHGIVNLRGNAATVVDLGRLLGLEQRTGRPKGACLVVLERDYDGERTLVAALADTVQEVVEIPREDVAEPPEMGLAVNPRFLRGLARLEDAFVMFSAAGDVIAAPVQIDGEYGVALNGTAWETLYENANNVILSPQGNASAAVVQVKSMAQADIATFQEGIFSVAVNGQVWDKIFVNCWNPAFDPAGKNVAATVRRTLYDYTIAVNGKAWAGAYACAWGPAFNPANGQVAAPVRKGGAWGMTPTTRRPRSTTARCATTAKRTASRTSPRIPPARPAPIAITSPVGRR